jgi:hypothetical protein
LSNRYYDLETAKYRHLTSCGLTRNQTFIFRDFARLMEAIDVTQLPMVQRVTDADATQLPMVQRVMMRPGYR